MLEKGYGCNQGKAECSPATDRLQKGLLYDAVKMP